jgi:hypothetical protein
VKAIAIGIAFVGLLAMSGGSFAAEPARCLKHYAPLKAGCDEDLGKCKRHVAITGEHTSCNEQYAFCQKHWKEIINRDDSECFKAFKGPKPGTAVLQPG